LPAALSFAGRRELTYNAPIPLGYRDKEGSYFIFNHLHFDLQVLPAVKETSAYNIVSFTVKPLSIDHHEMEKQDSMLASKAQAGSPNDIAQYL